MKTLTAVIACLVVATAALAVQPGTDIYLISTARVQGQCPGGICSLFRTDVWIFNPSTSQTANLQIVFLPRDTENLNPVNIQTAAVLPGQTVEYADIFQSKFNLDGVAGALRVISTNQVPVVVTSRIYDVNVVTNQGAGTAGQFYPGLPATQAIGNGQSTDVIGTAEEVNFRSNLSFVETTGNAATLRIDRLDPNGNVAGSLTNYTLKAREAKQINRVLTQLGATTATNQRLRVTVTGGSGRVLVAGSRLDNRTGDPYTIDMTVPAASGAHATGQFDGIVLTPDGSYIDGGIRTTIQSAGISAVSAVTGLPCGADSFMVDVLGTANPPIALGGDGSFTLTIPDVKYKDATDTQIFTITWTLTGALSTEGVLTGTLRSVTSGGSGSWAACNGTVDRGWSAGWTGNN